MFQHFFRVYKPRAGPIGCFHLPPQSQGIFFANGRGGLCGSRAWEALFCPFNFFLGRLGRLAKIDRVVFTTYVGRRRGFIGGVMEMRPGLG